MQLCLKIKIILKSHYTEIAKIEFKKEKIKNNLFLCKLHDNIQSTLFTCRICFPLCNSAVFPHWLCWYGMNCKTWI